VTVDQLVALLGAVTALIAALGAIWVQLRQTHKLVNSRLTQLLALTERSSRAEGVLEGQQTTSK
jgi:hypothetical protein